MLKHSRKRKKSNVTDFYNQEVPGMGGYASWSESDSEEEKFVDKIHVGSIISWYGKLNMENEMDVTTRVGTILSISGSDESASITVSFDGERKTLTSQNHIRLVSVADADGLLTPLGSEESSKKAGVISQFTGLVQGADMTKLIAINNRMSAGFKKIMGKHLNKPDESGLVATDYLPKQLHVCSLFLIVSNEHIHMLYSKSRHRWIMKLTNPQRQMKSNQRDSNYRSYILYQRRMWLKPICCVVITLLSAN